MSENRKITIRIAGHAQDGIQSLGTLLAKLAGRSGYKVMTYMTIPATIAGGNSIYQLRIGVEPILISGDFSDVLIAMHQDSLEGHLGVLVEGGTLIVDSDEIDVAAIKGNYEVIGLPLTKMLEELFEGEGGRGKNMVLLGMLSNLLGIDRSKVEELALEKFGKKSAQVLENVKKTLYAGFDYKWESGAPNISLPKSEETGEQVTMDGNSAVAYGLIAAGIRYGAAYPITPATSIMEVLREEFPKYKGIFVSDRGRNRSGLCGDWYVLLRSPCGDQHLGPGYVTENGSTWMGDHGGNSADRGERAARWTEHRYSNPSGAE